MSRENKRIGEEVAFVY